MLLVMGALQGVALLRMTCCVLRLQGRLRQEITSISWVLVQRSQGVWVSWLLICAERVPAGEHVGCALRGSEREGRRAPSRESPRCNDGGNGGVSTLVPEYIGKVLGSSARWHGHGCAWNGFGLRTPRALDNKS